MMTGVSVEYLKNITFSLLPLPEKIDIINHGRPTPPIIIHSSSENKNKRYFKNFNTEWYDKVKWLCGCETTNALFCFPCLLFGGDTVWTKNGFTSVNKMKEKTEKHQNSRRHLANMLSMSMLSQVNIADQLESSEILNVEDRLKHQQEILSKVVDCLKFGAKFELSHNFGGEVFDLLESLVSNVEPNFRKHVLVCGKTPEALREGLLQQMMSLCKEQIVYQISQASYAAVICEDVSHLSEDIHSIIVFRYEYKGSVYERFWGLLGSPIVAKSCVSSCLINEINIVLKKEWNKLIALSYLGCLNGENRKIEISYPNAHYVYNFSDDLDSILKQLTRPVKSVRIFFANLNSLNKFLTSDPSRLNLLYNRLSGTIPYTANFDVVTIYKIKSDLIQYLQDLQVADVPDKILQSAACFLSLLKDESFLFWLELFNKIAPLFEVMHQDIQTVEPREIPQTINEFCRSLMKTCNSINFASSGSSKILESRLVGDCICNELKEKFSFIGHLTAMKLFSANDLERFQSQIPFQLISETCQWYPEIVEEKLKIELQVFYSQKKFQNLNLLNLLNALSNENLSGMFSEMIKLLKILLTVPLMTLETGSVSKLEAIKANIRHSTMSLEKLATLCMISVENDMISEIDHFNSKILENYYQNGGLMF